MILKCLQQRFTSFLLLLFLEKLVSPMITFFLYFIENSNQGEDQGPVIAPYDVSKIIDLKFVETLSDAEKCSSLKKADDHRLHPFLISK